MDIRRIHFRTLLRSIASYQLQASSRQTMTLKDLIEELPKCELHCHLEGTLEPEFYLELARRHNVNVLYETPEEVRKAYQFRNLDSFLQLYYEGCNVLRTQQDFYDLTYRYLRQCSQHDNLVHTEVFCDPQSHTSRGIAFETVLNGIHQALDDGERDFGITSCIIVCFLRHLSADDAMTTLDQVLTYRGQQKGSNNINNCRIKGVGLDSSELGNEPRKFQDVFRRAQEAGLLCCCHAGEEGPPSYIWGAIQDLKVHRVDHGVRCLEDEALVDYLVQHQIPLTVCPLSNLKLAVVNDLRKHPLRAMLEAGLAASIHSDDPAYFGGYITENYNATAVALNLSAEEVVQLARNAVQGSFLEDDRKQALLAQIQTCYENHKHNE